MAMPLPEWYNVHFLFLRLIASFVFEKILNKVSLRFIIDITKLIQQTAGTEDNIISILYFTAFRKIQNKIQGQLIE